MKKREILYAILDYNIQIVKIDIHFCYPFRKLHPYVFLISYTYIPVKIGLNVNFFKILFSTMHQLNKHRFGEH